MICNDFGGNSLCEPVQIGCSGMHGLIMRLPEEIPRKAPVLREARPRFGARPAGSQYGVLISRLS
jgi:hypothetical protein